MKTTPEKFGDWHAYYLRHATHNQKDHGRKGAGSAGGLNEPDSGFTIDSGGRAIRTGWSVAIEGTSKFMSAEQFNTDDAAAKEFVSGFLRDARGQGVKSIGGWHDPAPDNPGKAIVLDHVRIFPKEQHDLARAFAVANNQKSMANLDAITAGDWDHAIEQTGGTGDRGRIPDHGEDTAHHGRVRHPAGRDVGRADRHPGRRDRGRHAGEPGFVDLDARYGLILRHTPHKTGTDQSVHGGGGGGGNLAKPIGGMADLDPNLQKTVLKDIEKKWGVPADEAAAISEANLVAMAEAGDLADAVWYEQQSRILGAIGEENGFTLEQAAGIASAESAQAKWDAVNAEGEHYGNLVNAQQTMRVLGKNGDKEFFLDQATIDNYNEWAGKPDNAHFNQHFDLQPDNYKPSQLPVDIAVCKTRACRRRRTWTAC